ncbi:hypothetical protein B0H67DRAFT_600845 [Lasiosphaeris hirsuta]|uniref:3-hydroxyacyl-CoA dehydrogenase n=1 Tax=Lasiosphaeris hirsuta TaxID=260670 RepID=A0AA40AFY0_9PEZI|nr:hypothetical protein B0H67DRAFT_600845 [Lasiosphaeris hirsuta]
MAMALPSLYTNTTTATLSKTMAGSPALAMRLFRSFPAVRAIPTARHISTSTATPPLFAASFASTAQQEQPAYCWKAPKEEYLDNCPVLIVGAGDLGRRIGLVWASNSRPVTIYDESQEALKSATEYLTDNLGEYCTRRRTHPGHVCFTTDLRIATTTGRFEGVTGLSHKADLELDSGSHSPWLVIDCLPENLELKIETFSHLEQALGKRTILASNSASLSTSEMAPHLQYPERLLNTHYFIPPRNRMVELMSSTRTDPEIFPFLAQQMRRVGLRPMIVPPGVQSPGFIFNRIWAACKRETLAVLAEGVAKPADVDALFRDFFHAEKGPCERMDEVGLDRVAQVEAHCQEQNPTMGKQHALQWLKENYVLEGKLGEKAGDGLYTKEEREELKERHEIERFKEVEETMGA